MKHEKARFVSMTVLIIPDNVSKTLQKGPKYAVEPKAKTVDLIGMVHDVARKVFEEERSACIAAGIGAVSNKLKTARQPGVNTNYMVRYIRENNCRHLLADKTEVSVILKQEMYKNKAKESRIKKPSKNEKTLTKGV